MSSSRRARSRRIKRILANIFIVLLAITSILLLVGLFLPRSYRVQRSIDIQAPPEAIFADLSDLKRWPEWTVWNQSLDPSIQFTYGDPSAGTGASYRWAGNQVGSGQLRLTRANPTNGVVYELEMEGSSMTSDGSIEMKSASNSVRVVWMNQGDLGKNPVNRYLGLFLDSMMGRQLEQGLSNLKARAESGTKQ